MKKLLQSYFTLSLLFFGNLLFGQNNMDFTIKFNTYSSEYEVYAKPDFSRPTFFVAAGSQLSIAVPASVGDDRFVVTSVTGGPWSDNSRAFVPGADTIQDFHSIASDGLALVNFASGVEELLFTFKLPSGGCVEGIRLFENSSDPQAGDLDMYNADFNNFFGDAFDLFSDFYQANYSNNGTVCSDPMLVPIPLTLEMDSSGIVCMNVLDANQLDSFTVNTCGAANGTPTVTITGPLVCVDYQPNGNYVGTDTVCVIVCDQTGNCDKTLVPITVVAPPLVTTVPEPPVIYPSPITMPADSTISVCVPVLDPNAGSTFTPTLCGVPNGTATPTVNNGSLCLTFTPDAGFLGDTEICVVVCDQTGLCDTVTFPVNVFPLPVQVDSSQAQITTLPAVVTPEDTPISTCGTIADANTTDTYTATICATPANVTATASIDNTNNQVCINVFPNLHFNGHDVVCVVVCDQNNVCDTIQVPVTVTSVNDKPIAILDRDTTDEDVLIVFDVQGNDIEIDNDPLTTTIIGNSTQGSTPTVVNDSISYLAPLNFYGIDTITYQICDNGTPQLCDTALAIIQVGPINDVPVAMGDTTDVNEDEYVTIMVQMDDQDVDMDDLTTTVILAPTHGTYTIIALDSIQYKADTNYTGMDMLIYKICDNGLAPQLCDTATVYINIIPVNDKPFAVNDSAIVTMNINNNIIPVEINDRDIEDSLLYLTPISSTRGATLSAVNDTLLGYDPPFNYSGFDTVLYQICDQDTPNLCDTATVIVFVKPDGDNDGIANIDDLDDDNDGIPDAIEGFGDADGDGIPNNFDLDSDNDGIPDILEAGGADANGDGRIDIAGSDFDVADADDDGIMDILDSGNGINDTLSNLTNGTIYTNFPSNAIDTDRDGLPDYLDIDSDNDGIVDLIEAGGVDTDGDGRIDTPIDNDSDGWTDIYDGDYDAILSNGTDNPQGTGAAMGPLMVTAADLNADGTPGIGGSGGFSGGDFDGDLVPDFRDLDSDNDGLPDLIEVGGTDIDGDGIIDDFDDADNDGYDDNYDTDDDGTPGRDDPVTEALVTTDPDGTGADEDGRPTDFDNNGTAIKGITADIDSDGNPDYKDLDADNDGIPDLIEMGGTDINGDGVIDDSVDEDGDGFDDKYDVNDNATASANDGTGSPLVTTDEEGTTADGRPEDTDSNGTPYNGATADVDSDGLPDSEDLDADNDGIPDLIEMGGTDIDGNGIIDDFVDADGDGFDDTYDADDNSTPAANDGGSPLVTTDPEGSTDDGRPEDDDADGTAINGETADVDQDGKPDSEDLDADNDGIPDLIEIGGTDTDNNGVVDNFTDADNDGFDDANDPTENGTPNITTDPEGTTDDGRPEDDDSDGSPYNNPETDIDNDGILNSEDLDTDNDGISDIVDNGQGDLDTDNDGTIDSDDDNYADTDGDGIADPVDEDPTNYGDDNPILVDTDADGTPNHEDVDADGDGINDVDEIGLGDLDTDNDGMIDETDEDTDGIADTPDNNDDDADSTDFGGLQAPNMDWLHISVRMACVNPWKNQVTIKNFGTVAVDISDYRICSKLNYTTDLASQTVLAGALTLGAGSTVTIQLTQITLDSHAADIALYLTGTTSFTDSLQMQDFTQWGTGGQGRENVAVAKGIWEAGTYISNERPEYCYVGDGTEEGAIEWKGHLVAHLTEEGERQTICADTKWTVNHPITATNCAGTLTGTATGAGGSYSIDATTGCIRYTAPIDPTVLIDSVCIVICDANNICDTSYAVFPIDTIDVQYPIFPLDPSETTTVCVDTTWQILSPMAATDCEGQNSNTTAIGGTYTIDALTNCVTYTAPSTFVAHHDTVCVITCDDFGVCDTSEVVFPLDSTDIAYPPAAVDPTDMPTVCVDLSWVSGNPLAATDCAGNTSGIAPSNGGTYTIDPASGCVTYTPPSTPLNTSHDTVCVVVCDINNVCDTSIIVFPLDTIDQAMPVIPVVPGDTSMVCVDTSWITQMPITATDCNGQPFGNATGVMGKYSVDVTNGCITYIAPESMIDVAGDTICMILCDANGVCDTSEVVFLFDMDGDLIADINDYDDDNDGIPDAIEGMIDTDKDGIYDQFDLDSDNDGIQDVLEAGGVDANGDGRVDIAGISWNAADADNDGLLDAIDSGLGLNDTLSNLTNGTIYTQFSTTAIDTDGDGISDFRDIDSDNDGITDLIEAGGADENGDGIVDIFADADADGWSNYYDGDNDVLLFNGINNPQNLINGTGALMTTDPDTNGDGTPGTNGNGGFNGGDFDRDTTPDFRDLDSDNDGQPDLIEVGGTDENGDGQIDDFNDADQDGYDDTYDTDDDGVAGVEDPLTEPLITTDPDGSSADENGRPTDTDNNGVTYNGQTVDIDNDGNPDHLDLDADNDGIPDLIEVGGTDEDGDGQIDNFNDADKDGFDDSYDPNNNSNSTPNDGTGEPLISTDPEGTTDDGRPEDDDNDGSAYNGETADVDSDGIPDAEDLDSDNDGIPDLIEMGGTDTDGNGVIDDFNDPDGDGFDDTYDADNNATPTDNDGGTPLVTTDPEGTTDDGRPEDTNNDGTEINGPTADVDSDGIMDSEDVDADNDGITDLIEVGGTDVDGDGQIDNFNDTDGDGFDDTYSPEESGLPLVTTDPEGTTEDGRPEDDDNDGTAYNSAAVDTDTDGVMDSEDLDSDNDGTPDLIETGGTDTNGDGQIDNPIDADKDGYDDRYDTNDNTIPGTNDGTGNPLVKTDAEGTTEDGRPEDTNNDGTLYDGETADVDSDGIPDMEDLDSDNDGLPDLIEMGGTDTDGNGIIDDFNDTDGDGFDDTYTTDPLISTDPEGTTNDGRPEDTDENGSPYNGPTADVDNDGVPDSEDLDADNDGIPDLIEMGGTDTDGDGVIDDFNDPDGNGFDETYSTNPLITTDREGTTNNGRPEDDDNDGSAYDNVPSADTDMDGVPDSEDVDTDNDGTPDLIETGGIDSNGDGKIDNPVDADGDGYDDRYDKDDNTTTTPMDGTGNPLVTTDPEGTTEDGRPEDTDNSGSVYNGETVDVDSDGIPDMEDLDADNDGTPDLIEAGGTDVNGDGIIDDFNDPDGNGFDETYSTDPLITTDPEGTTNDGRPEDIDNNGSAYNGPTADVDHDGIPDSEDLDADNDGITDLIEMGGTDENADGVIDDFNDTDGNGFDDTYSPENGGTPLINTDPEGTMEDGRPEDDDNDGTAINGPSADVDHDGIPDSEDVDSDNDAIPDLVEVGGTDSNGDGRIDEFEDTDGDGMDDTYDSTTNGTPLVSTDPEGTTEDGRPEDTNNNGTTFTGEQPDNDMDGIIDSEDLDSDNDGIPDLIEVGGADTNGDGQIDDLTDTDGDGFDDSYDPTNSGNPLVTTDPEGTTDDGRPEDTDENGTVYNGGTVDVDHDGVPDFEDLDSDNDGLPDLIEMGGTDTDGDGVIDDFDDIDGNGFDDTYSPETFGFPFCWTAPDVSIAFPYFGFSCDIDGDGILDSEDLDADNDGIPDLIEVGGTDTDGDGAIDDFNDIDGDGFDDNYDPDNNLTQIDENEVDNPLVTTDSEGTTDDGRPEDDDNDGTAYNGVSPDMDYDGIPDNEDLDADNDGIPDYVEVGGADIDGNGVVDNFVDVDGDGFADSIDPDNNNTPTDENDMSGVMIKYFALINSVNFRKWIFSIDFL